MNKEIKKEDLCFVGQGGKKLHIKYPSNHTNHRFTYCSFEAGAPLKEKGLLGLTEKAEELCRNCLQEYKRRLELKEVIK